MGAFCIFALQNSICEDACDVHSKKNHKLGINSTHAPTSQSFRTCDRTRWRRFLPPHGSILGQCRQTLVGWGRGITQRRRIADALGLGNLGDVDR